MQCMCSIIDNVRVYFLAWMDSKPVHFVTTLKSTRSYVIRKVKELRGVAFHRKEIPRPDAVGVYNRGMGGTDKHDQLNSYYRTVVRCNKWPIRIITHLFHSCATNAYILYKTTYGFSSEQLSLLEFLNLIIDEAERQFDEDVANGVDEAVEDEEDLPAGEPVVYVRRVLLNEENRFDHEDHWPYSCDLASDGTTRRGGCVVCKKKVVSGCEKCKRFLCIKKNEEGNSCYKQFHTV